MSENKVPFTTIDTPKELVERMHDQMERPFTTIDTPPKKKLYLILKVINDQDGTLEEERDFDFFKGTTQELYDHLRMEILSYNGQLDVMKSRVLVDAPNIRISHKCSIFMFMKDTKDLKKIIDDTAFDIMEYYSDEEGDDIVG